MGNLKSEMRKSLLEQKDTNEKLSSLEISSMLDLLEVADNDTNKNPDVARADVTLEDTFLRSIEAIDLDDIAAILACGKQYSVLELVKEFGITVEDAEYILKPKNEIDISKAIAESEAGKMTGSIFDDEEIQESGLSLSVELLESPAVEELQFEEIAEDDEGVDSESQIEFEHMLKELEGIF